VSRLLDDHKTIMGQARSLVQRASQLGDERINNLVVSEALRMNELRTWFMSAQIVNVPLVTAVDPSSDAPGRIAPPQSLTSLKRLGENETIPPSEQMDRCLSNTS
jgi:hypothetical protein